LLIAWIAVNVAWAINAWDPYPFILLNLCLSTLAAFQAPVILMSQNRQAERDRYRDEIDFARDRLDLRTDLAAAENIHEVRVHLVRIEKRIAGLEKGLRK
jgi:uncharacterized membrane protein